MRRRAEPRVDPDGHAALRDVSFDLRANETLNVLTNAELVIHSCLARKASSKELHFQRIDYPELDPPDWHRFVTIEKQPDGVKTGSLPLDYYGDFASSYAAHNADYIREGATR